MPLPRPAIEVTGLRQRKDKRDQEAMQRSLKHGQDLEVEEKERLVKDPLVRQPTTVEGLQSLPVMIAG
jgi:hypothetical protein